MKESATLDKDHETGTAKKLIQLCKANDEVIANTWIQNHARHLLTLRTPGGDIMNQTDYITFSKRFNNMVLYCKTYKCWLQGQPFSSSVLHQSKTMKWCDFCYFIKFFVILQCQSIRSDRVLSFLTAGELICLKPFFNHWQHST